ncbi:MAG: hypothetical protein ACLRR6_00800 [Oscillospiraceae bacterium]
MSIKTITHKLNEVKMCADNITVIRAGHVIGTVPNDENTTDEDLAEMMVGRAVLLRVKKSGKPVGGKVAYQVNHLSAVNSEGKRFLMTSASASMKTRSSVLLALRATAKPS